MTAPRNLSFVLEAPGEVKFQDRPIPQLNSPYDVSVRVMSTGICGSDVHFWQDGRIGHLIVKDPMVLGHESAGIVTDTGRAVTLLTPGDRVALEPGVPCRRCDHCKAGRYNLCGDMRFAATPPCHGTLAKYYVLPEDFCYKLPPDVSLDEGALVEPLSVAVHMVRQADMRPGDRVVVFGAGPVGLLVCAVSRVFAAAKIVAVDIKPERLAFARKYAATGTFAPERGASAEESAARLKEDEDLGEGADVVIDASGAEMSVQTGIHVLRSGGTYVQGGMGTAEVNFPITTVCIKEINVRGTFRYASGDYALAVELLGSGKVSVKELITRKVPFSEAEQAFRDVRDGKEIKLIIEGVPD